MDPLNRSEIVCSPPNPQTVRVGGDNSGYNSHQAECVARLLTSACASLWIGSQVVCRVPQYLPLGEAFSGRGVSKSPPLRRKKEVRAPKKGTCQTTHQTRPLLGWIFRQKHFLGKNGFPLNPKQVELFAGGSTATKQSNSTWGIAPNKWGLIDCRAETWRSVKHQLQGANLWPNGRSESPGGTRSPS